MSAELERVLSERLQRADLPAAPVGLRESLERVVEAPVARRDGRDRRRTMRLLAVAALVATGGLAVLVVGGGLERNVAIVVDPSPSPRAISSPATPSSDPSSPSQAPSTPAEPEVPRPSVLNELPAGTLRTVAAGPNETCAIRPDRRLLCWGGGGGPVPTGTYESLSVGESGGCAVATDGAIQCWNSEHRPPSGTFRSVSVGELFTCAIRTDDTAACWPSGGTMFGDDGNGLGPQPPEGTYESVSVGWFGCGIRTDKTLACWGEDLAGAVPPAGTYSVVSVGSRACAIRTDGELLCWGGEGSSGQPPGAFSAVSISLFGQACAIRSDQTMTCWSTELDDNATRVVAPSPVGTWSSVSAGTSHACGVRTDDTIACWAHTPQDAAAPGPTAAFRAIPDVTYGPVRLRWSGTLFGAELTTWDVEYRLGREEEDWRSLLAGTTATETEFEPEAGSSYTFRVRVHDADGLVSPWATEGTAAPADDGSLEGSSEWRQVRDPQFYGSSATRTTKGGATLTGPVGHISSFAIIATECPDCGRVRVSIGGIEVGILDLDASKRQTNLHCVSGETGDDASGPLAIEVLSTGQEVTIDGYLFDAPCE